MKKETKAVMAAPKVTRMADRNIRILKNVMIRLIYPNIST
jgi:hypothetical protein